MDAGRFTNCNIYRTETLLVCGPQEQGLRVDRLSEPGRGLGMTIAVAATALLAMATLVSAAVLCGRLFDIPATRALGFGHPMWPLTAIGYAGLALAGAAWLLRHRTRSTTTVGVSDALDEATVVILTPEGRILHWSRGCEQLYGWSAGEARGQYKYALLRSRCPFDTQDVRGELSGDAIELIELCRDGREIAVIESQRRVEHDGCDPVIVLSISEITRRLFAVEALRTSEERLAIATSANQLGVVEWNVVTGKVHWSPGTELRLGMAEGAMPDFDTWRSRVEPEDSRQILETVARAVRDRAPIFSFRYRLVSAHGVRTIEGSSRMFYDRDGNLLRTVGGIRDVTDREERDAALRKSEGQLRSILDTVPEAMVVMDQAGSIVAFSAAAEKLWGYRAQEVLGRHVATLAPIDTRPVHLSRLARFVETGEGIVGEIVDTLAETADGRRIPVEIRTGVAHSDDGMLLTLFARDLREQIETESRISELSAQIAHVSRQSAMSELAADLAHELNQPLSAVANFLSAARLTIDDGATPAQVTDLLRQAGEQTQRAGEIIRRMRAFMARGEIEMCPESVEQTVRDAAELVLTGTSRFGISVSFDLDPAAPTVFADRIQVQQVIVNLMRNAMEALRNSDRPDRNILLSSQRLGGQSVEIAVVDNGPGIPAKILEQLFSRFTTTKGAGCGMGIGLSISKRIIEGHGGTLTAENMPEGGAVFRFTLPMAEEGEDR